MVFCCLPRIVSQKGKFKNYSRSNSLEQKAEARDSSFYFEENCGPSYQSTKNSPIQKTDFLGTIKTKHSRFASSSSSFAPIKIVKCKQILLKNKNPEEDFLAHLNISKIKEETTLDVSSESLAKEIQKFEKMITEKQNLCTPGNKRTIKEFNRYTRLRTRIIPVLMKNPCFTKKCNEGNIF